MNPEFEKQFRSISEHITAFGGKIDALDEKVNAVQKQADGIDMQLATRLAQASFNENPIETQMKESDSLSRLFKERRGTAVVKFKDAAYARLAQGLKTTITETQQGFMTTGVMPIERIPGIVPEAWQILTVRNVLTATPTTQAVVDFVRVSTPLSIASPVPEASLKPENQLSFNSISEKVRTLATWVPASKQILDDMTEMMGFIQSSMPYYVNLAEELQLLFGDGTGENLQGLIPQATAFVGGLPAGSTRIDAIGAAIAQIQTAKETAAYLCHCSSAGLVGHASAQRQLRPLYHGRSADRCYTFVVRIDRDSDDKHASRHFSGRFRQSGCFRDPRPDGTCGRSQYGACGLLREEPRCGAR